MRGKTILVIDDDAVMCEVVRRIFESAGAYAYSANDGEQGLKELYKQRPDLVLLDVMMPGMDGFEVLKRIRQLSDVPVVMLTVKDSHKDIARSLDAGADDHVAKPFHKDELLARVRAVLRRVDHKDRRETSPDYDDGYLYMDLASRQILVAGVPATLTATEFGLLAFLVRNAGRICTYDRILDKVWGVGQHGSAQNVYTFIYQLRRKLEPDRGNPVYLITAPGVGYTFRPRAGAQFQQALRAS